MGKRATKAKLPEKPFLVFGLQRSGTGFVSKIMHHNFGANGANVQMGLPAYWKHQTSAPPLDVGMPVIVVWKHPVLWIESILARNPHDFFRTHGTDFKAKPREPAVNDKGLTQLATFWGRWYAEWCIRQAPRAMLLPYASLVAPAGLTNACLQFERVTGYPMLHDYYVRPPVSALRQSPNYSPERDDPYYMKQTPLRLLNRKQAKHVVRVATEVSGREWSLSPFWQ